MGVSLNGGYHSEAPIIRTRVFWNLNEGPPIFRNYLIGGTLGLSFHNYKDL